MAADYGGKESTSIDFALNYSDPIFEMLRSRLRREMLAKAAGSQNALMGALESRGMGQSSLVSSGFGDIAGQTAEGLGSGLGSIAGAESGQRFSLLKDALQRQYQDSQKPSFLEAGLPALLGGVGALAGGGLPAVGMFAAQKALGGQQLGGYGAQPQQRQTQAGQTDYQNVYDMARMIPWAG